MFQVRTIFIRGLTLETSALKVMDTVSNAVGMHISYSRVQKVRDYAFVSFGDTQTAILAVEMLNSKSRILISYLAIILLSSLAIK